MSQDKTSAETSAPSEQETNAAALIERVERYVRNVRVEIRQVSWPTWKQVRSTTFVVLSFTLAVTVFIRVVDAIAAFFYQLAVGR